jgi:hypothetical protein
VIHVREGARAFREAKGRQPADKEELGRFITAASRPTQQAVAGFDLVFSPARSVSTLWGLGDNDTRQVIERAHEAAIEDTVKYLETEAIATRAGRNGVAQIDVEGDERDRQAAAVSLRRVRRASRRPARGRAAGRRRSLHHPSRAARGCRCW